MKIAPIWLLLYDVLTKGHTPGDWSFYLYEWKQIQKWGHFNAVNSNRCSPWFGREFVIASFDPSIPF